MRVVIDANIAAAALVAPDGWTADEARRPDLQLFAPADLEREIAEHAEELADKARCTVREWTTRTKDLLRRVATITPSEYHRYSRHEFVRAIASVDPDDAPYAAVFVAVDAAFLWTRDKRLIAAEPFRCVAVVPGQ